MIVLCVRVCVEKKNGVCECVCVFLEKTGLKNVEEFAFIWEKRKKQCKNRKSGKEKKRKKKKAKQKYVCVFVQQVYVCVGLLTKKLGSKTCVLCFVLATN